jgi:hypothetical protein
LPENNNRPDGYLLIVDNSDTDWKVKRNLQDWADIANSFDIASGYFEIGALLALNETIHLMKEIDELVEKHGGWPGAFIAGEE